MNRSPQSTEGGEGPTGEEAPAFEASLKRLSEIVQALEKGDLPLEDSLRLFEEGVRLSRASQARLDAAEKRVDELLAVDESGRARTAAFGNDGSEGESGGVDRAQRPMAPR
jgi:exodeoxyribonuclease VII small subunit